MWLLLAMNAGAEPPTLHGAVKSFFVVSMPRLRYGLSEDAKAFWSMAGASEEEILDGFLLSPHPIASGVGSGRLMGHAALGPVQLDVHWAFAAQTAVQSGFVGAPPAAPELLPLSWAPDTGPSFVFQHRVDRLVLSARLPSVTLSLGRQPISFGVGRIFTPLDLINPFNPATIDTEYKPGVDAFRTDAYLGTSTQISLVGAWAGAPVLGKEKEEGGIEDAVLAATGRTTVGVTDLLAFVGDVRAEPVFGLGTESALGPVGIHAEATLTLPQKGDPFVRAVVGADGRPTSTTTLSGEFYLQSFGADDPTEYLQIAESSRFERGEVWQMGQLYAAFVVAQEITPLVSASASVISNLRDPSALLSLNGSWSVADNADVVFGGYVGLGASPDTILVDFPGGVPEAPSSETIRQSVNSEFGLYPSTAFLQIRAYF